MGYLEGNRITLMNLSVDRPDRVRSNRTVQGNIGWTTRLIHDNQSPVERVL